MVVAFERVRGPRVVATLLDVRTVPVLGTIITLYFFSYLFSSFSDNFIYLFLMYSYCPHLTPDAWRLLCHVRLWQTNFQ